MTDQDNYIFLLGGHDLEMEEIREILDAQGLRYHDLKLEWGAKLSAYQHFFDHEHTFVGIELIEDIALPDKYIEIDHHNEKSELSSSIEQIALLLGVTLDRRQRLVAANDKGYIPAMRAMGASDQEIKEIREADRRAQGVTIEDEVQAELAIRGGRSVGELLIIYYDGFRFSPITDRVKAKHLIVWNFNSLNYYGDKTELVKEQFHQLITDKKAYFGGNPLSFFGLVKNWFNESEIMIIKEVIIKIVTYN